MTPPVTPPGGSPVQQPPSVSNPPANTANVSSSKMYEASFADYTAGQWDLAVEGFQSYIRLFPRTDKTDDAQLNIGNSLYGAGKRQEAVAAYQRVISEYPDSDSVPVAYYKLGLTYEALKQTDPAKKAYETVIEKYPTAYEAILAKQRLDNLNRRTKGPNHGSQDHTDHARIHRLASRSPARSPRPGCNPVNPCDPCLRTGCRRPSVR